MSLLGTDMDVPCPACSYPIWIRLVEVVVGTAVRCPACLCRVWLVDESGTVQNASRDVDRALEELGRSLKGWS